jgi:hypothetical protein
MQSAREESNYTYPDEAILGLELLGGLEVVVDETEAGGLAASEVGAELEDEDAVGVFDLVHLRQPLLQLRLRHKTSNPQDPGGPRNEEGRRRRSQ